MSAPTKQNLKFFDDGVEWIEAGRGFITKRREDTDDYAVVRYDETFRCYMATAVIERCAVTGQRFETARNAAKWCETELSRGKA